MILLPLNGLIMEAVSQVGDGDGTPQEVDVCRCMSRDNLPPLSCLCLRLCLWQVSKLTDGTKLWGAVASGSFVGRLTTGRVDDATRKMTWPSKGGGEVQGVYWFTGGAARLQFKF